MIRLKEWLVWKPQEGAGEFEILVTSGHDRIFGEMVRAQRMEMKKKEEEEYKRRKMAEREAKAKKAEAKEGGSDIDQHKAEAGADDKGKKDQGPKAEGGKVGVVKKQVQDKEKEKEHEEKEQDELKGAKVMIALPIKDLKHLPEAIKHEQEPHLVGPAPGEPKAEDRGGQEKKGEKGGKDGEDDKVAGANVAHMTEKLLEGDKDVKMGDIKAAFKALEDAAGG